MLFQPGERVELVHTDDPHTRLRPGDTGTVTRHDQTTAGEVVHVAWDDGSRLSMCLDAGDRIRRIPTPATPDKPGSDPADTHQPAPVTGVTKLEVPGLLTLELDGGVRVSLVPRPDGAAHIGVGRGGRVFAVLLSADQVQAVRAALKPGGTRPGPPGVPVIKDHRRHSRQPQRVSAADHRLRRAAHLATRRRTTPGRHRLH